MGLSVVNPDAAAADIDSEYVWVSVPEDRDIEAIRRFETFTEGLQEMVRWLKACGIKTVAMESTGVYWIPIYGMLEEHGIRAHLVNAKHYMNVPGRKSDIRDCVWLRELHSFGLLRGSFIPDESTLTMRSYIRHRNDLVQHRATHINHAQKSLVQMNVRLDTVVKDVAGKTGMAIMRAIALGETRPEALVKLRNRQCKATPEEFVKALTAYYRVEHQFALKQSLELYDAYTEQIALCDKQIEAFVASIKMDDMNDDSDARPPLEASRKKNTHSKNEPDYDVRGELYRLTGVDLTEVDGLHAATAQIIISEIGLDMSKWPSAKHFTSWLGLSPKNDITGGKVKRSRTLPGNQRASQAFKMAAQSLLRADCALGAYARQMRARFGSPKGIAATAHKLARVVYCMLRDKTPYQRLSAADYDKANFDRERKSLERRAKRLGFALTAAEPAAAT